MDTFKIGFKTNCGEADHRFCQTSKSFWQEITGATHSWATKHWIEPAYCHRRMSAEWVPNVATKSASSSSSWTPPNSIIPARIAWKWQQFPEFGALKNRQDLEKNILQSMKFPQNYAVWRVTDFGLAACAIDQTPSCLRQHQNMLEFCKESMLLMKQFEVKIHFCVSPWSFSIFGSSLQHLSW